MTQRVNLQQDRKEELTADTPASDENLGASAPVTNTKAYPV